MVYIAGDDLEMTMQLSGEAQRLIKLKSTTRLSDIQERHEDQIYRYQLEADRSGSARAALDREFATVAREYVEETTKDYISEFRRERSVPSDDDISEICHSLNQVVNGIWYKRNPPPLPGSSDLVTNLVPRARLELQTAAKEMALESKRSTIQDDPSNETPLSARLHIVDETRLKELRSLPNTSFDFQRLVRLCEELNIAYSNGALHAVAALTRATLDHVAPIFGFRSFREVVNNYAGTKSFKEAMNHLEGSARKIADAHLHTPIRGREVLPTATQVNFAPSLDLLLAEIVRLSR